MKYFFSFSVSGEIDDKADEGQSESLNDIQKIVADSFPQNLVAGVTVRQLNISVHEQVPPPNGMGAGPMTSKVGY